jgi:hypothetical protein
MTVASIKVFICLRAAERAGDTITKPVGFYKLRCDTLSDQLAKVMQEVELMKKQHN